MNTQEFTEAYIQVLRTDPKTKETYIKIPIADYRELGYLQQSLLETLHLLALLEDGPDTDKKGKDSIFWLSKILLASYPAEELEGIDGLIKVASKSM